MPLSARLLIFAAFFPLAFAPEARAILNGRPLGAALPSVGFLGDDLHPHRCSAVLVGPRVILTAAHCATSDHLQFQAMSGLAADVAFLVDPQYGGSMPNVPADFAARHDIAVGILSNDVGVSPANVADFRPYRGQAVVVAGTGLPTRRTRQFGMMSVVSSSANGVTLRGDFDVPQTGAPGDSGGGAFVKNGAEAILVGILSTSTDSRDLRAEFRWADALPFTTGVARLGDEKSFIDRVVAARRLSVCGISSSCAGNRYPER